MIGFWPQPMRPRPPDFPHCGACWKPAETKIEAPNDFVIHNLRICDACLEKGFDAFKLAVEARWRGAP